MRKPQASPGTVFGLSLVGLLGVFGSALVDWFKVARSADLHSHILLIPLVTAYLLHVNRPTLGASRGYGRWVGWSLLVVGLVARVAVGGVLQGLELVDSVALRMVLLLACVWGLALGIFGWRWCRQALFPLGFLVFMIPLPGFMEVAAERALMAASAHASEWVIHLSGIPVRRDGQVLELPGFNLEVAQECSGIRSSYVLLITSILAAYLFLEGGMRRSLLVLAVIPLGILRNALRIQAIAWLCLRHGQEMIDHWIHRRGGPLFFAISLLPLFALAWLLRRKGGEAEAKSDGRDSPPDEVGGQGVSSR